MTIHETMLSTFAEICAELAVRGSYTGAAVASLTEQVCWENLFHEIRDRAEPSMLSTQTVCSPMRSSTVVKSSLTATQHCCGVSLPTLKKMMSWTRPGIWKCGCWRI